MPQTPPQQTKTSRDFGWLTGTLALVVIWVLPEIIYMLRTGSYVTRLSPAVSGDLLASELTTATNALYITALVLKFLSLCVAAWAIVAAIRPMMKGDIFTTENGRWLTVASIAMLIWFVARMGLEGLANNFAAATLGIDSWWESGSRTPMSEYAPALLFFVSLNILWLVIRRGIALREEVDGLV